MMTTRQLDHVNINQSRKPSSLPPLIYKLEYPNCRTGVFSFRAPFTNSYGNENYEQVNVRSPGPNVVHPEYLHVGGITRSAPYDYRQSSQRDVEVQCTLVPSNSYDDNVGMARYRNVTKNIYDVGYLSPGYCAQIRLQPVELDMYEVWDLETPPVRPIPMNQSRKYREPSIRVRSPRLVDIQPLSDDEFDQETDRALYTCYSKEIYLPSNVHRVCVKRRTNMICY